MLHWLRGASSRTETAPSVSLVDQVVGLRGDVLRLQLQLDAALEGLKSAREAHQSALRLAETVESTRRTVKAMGDELGAQIAVARETATAARNAVAAFQVKGGSRSVNRETAQIGEQFLQACSTPEGRQQLIEQLIAQQANGAQDVSPV